MNIKNVVFIAEPLWIFQKQNLIVPHSFTFIENSVPSLFILYFRL
jgi:hypothetical protein